MKETGKAVTVKWVSDQTSLRALMADLDAVEARLDRIARRAGGVVGMPSHSGALPTPAPHPGRSDNRGPVNQPPMGGGGMLPSPMGGLPQSMMVGTLAVTTPQVTIQAQRVILQGPAGGQMPGMPGFAGSPGGAFTPQMMAAMIAMLASGTGTPLLRNNRLGTLFGGGGGFGTAVAGNFMNALLPIAPAMLPLAIAQMTMSGFLGMESARSDYALRMGGLAIGSAAGARPEDAFSVRRMIDRERTFGHSQTGFGFSLPNAFIESTAKNWLVSAVTGGLSGHYASELEKWRERHIQIATESELSAARMGRSMYGLNSKRMRRSFAEFSMGGPESSALDSYLFERVNEITGGLNSVLFNNSFTQFRKGAPGGVSGLDQVVFPMVAELMQVSMQQFPGQLANRRRGDWDSMFPLAAGSAYTAALRGDLQGVMGFSKSLVAQGGEELLNQVLDTLQQQLTVQKDIRVSNLRIAGLESQLAGAESGLQLSLYRGAEPTGSMRSGQRGLMHAKHQEMQAQLSRAHYRMSAAQATGDIEEVERLNAEIAAIQSQLESSKLGMVESLRSDSFERYGFRQSQVGLSRARTESKMERESRLGDAGSISAVERERLQIIDQQLAAEREKLELSKQGALKASEINEINASIISLLAQRQGLEIDIGRRELSMRNQLAGTRLSTFTAQLGTAYLIGGSAGAGASQDRIAGSRRSVISDIERQIALERGRSSPDNQYLAELESQLEHERASLVSDAAQPYRASYGLRRESRQLDTYSQVISRTFSAQGDVRGGYQAQLALAQKELDEIEAKYQRDIARARTEEERMRVQEQYEMDKQQVILGRALPAQQALESGWQERLISSVYGGSSSFNMVASQFTQREASAFYGIYNRAFGGTKEQMEYARGQGALWRSAVSAVQHPEGFLNTAMGGGEGARPVRLEGGLVIDVNIKEGGNIVETQRQQIEIGQHIRQVNPVTENVFLGG